MANLVWLTLANGSASPGAGNEAVKDLPRIFDAPKVAPANPPPEIRP